jgi:glycine oxidase
MNSPQHVIVVGAGIVGLFTALALRATGASVSVYEAGSAAAQQSSWSGGGILSPLWPWAASPSIQRWAMAAHRAYPGWADWLMTRTGIDVEYRRTGVIWQLDRTADVEKAQRWHRRWGLPCDMDGDCRIISPALAQVRNPRLGRALALAAQSIGIGLQLDAAAQPVLRNGRVIGVASENRGFEAADAVVVAAGAWSATLLRPLGVVSDVRPVKGQMLLFAQASDSVALPSVLIGRTVYLIPRSDGQIVVGSTVEDAGFDLGVSEAAQNHLWSEAMRLWPPLADHQLVAQWAGLRPGSTRRPACGPTQVPGLWVNTGHFRNGITLAPATSARLATRLMGRMASRGPLLPDPGLG